ncbi:MAG: pirin family protein, partial [Neisseriaceae bacterium]|nr:pirin family protein [Neisseriaceae bacterium]
MGEFSKFQAKIRDVGGIPIKRLLPNIGKKTIGAWCFLDHAGPREFKPNEKTMQVAHHPHSFLQTFTWMLEGEILHKDSLGNEMVIKKNQVNLMTAGHGISHTEQMLLGENKFHALQLWIALPKETGDSIPPSFYNYPDIPCWIDDKDKS